MAFTLIPLPYPKDSLEPYFDSTTMEIHHDKHHKAYVTNLNKAIENTSADKLSIEDILRNISEYPIAVRNNAGGHYNHTMFWTVLSPSGNKKPLGELAEAINWAFGSFSEFKNKFTEAASGIFGSGWAWLVKNASGGLEIGSTSNQDNPLMDITELSGFPVVGLDIWEHAYYLKYQNRRAEYITAWWNIVDWEEASKRFSLEKKMGTKKELINEKK